MERPEETPLTVDYPSSSSDSKSSKSEDSESDSSSEDNDSNIQNVMQYQCSKPDHNLLYGFPEGTFVNNQQAEELVESPQDKFHIVPLVTNPENVRSIACFDAEIQNLKNKESIVAAHHTPIKNIKKKKQEKYLDIYQLVEILNDILETPVYDLFLGCIEFSADGRTLERIVVPNRQIYLHQVRKTTTSNVAE